MVEKNKLISSLYQIVGFRQPTDPTFSVVLDADNKVSRSGYYINDDPFAKLTTLLDTQDNSEINDLQFNALLKQLQQRSITDVVNAVFSDADFIERGLLYNYPNNKVETTTLSGMVGREIVHSGAFNVAFNIKRVILEFEGTGTLRLLLFHTSRPTPIYAKNINITSTYQIESLNWICNNSDHLRGDYRLCYIATSGLKPYKRNYEYSNIKNIFTHIRFRDFRVNHTTETMWDLRLEEGLSDDCGVNPDIVIYHDYTDLVMQSEELFAAAISQQCVVNIIEYFASSKRSNVNQRISNEFLSRAMVYIEGQDDPNIVGLTKKIANQIELIKEHIKRLKDNHQPHKMVIRTLS
jgi:hypothetical protein